jgi:hypothetical protein
MSLSTVKVADATGAVKVAHCAATLFIDKTVNAMTIQLNNWVRNDFGIVLVFGDEKRADFGDKLDACVDKIDGLNAEFWLLFIILILIR